MRKMKIYRSDRSFEKKERRVVRLTKEQSRWFLQIASADDQREKQGSSVERLETEEDEGPTSRTTASWAA